MRIKKAVTLFLAAAMVLFSLPAQALAVESGGYENGTGYESGTGYASGDAEKGTEPAEDSGTQDEDADQGVRDGDAGGIMAAAALKAAGSSAAAYGLSDEPFELVAEGPVEIDGTADKTVNVYMRAKDDLAIQILDACWSTDTTEEIKYGSITLTGISENEEMVMAGKCVNDAAAGEFYWDVYQPYWAGETDSPSDVQLSAGDEILVASYTVSKDAFPGEYTVSLQVNWMNDTDWNYWIDNTTYTTSITVLRSDVPEHDESFVLSGDSFVLVGTNVELDGTEDKTAELYLKGAEDFYLWKLNGTWGAEAADGYITLDAEQETVSWTSQTGYGSQVLDETLSVGSYVISKYTHSGEYTVSFTVDTAAAYGWQLLEDTVLTAVITVENSAEPEQNGDGAYRIGTAEQLRWFAHEVNNGAVGNADAVLTADIDVSDEAWSPIGTSSAPYTGTFNGGGYSVELNASLFTAIGDGAVIEDLTVTGTVSGGGIAQAATGGTISGCVNRAQISGIDCGGIVGIVTGPVDIEECVNYGAVSASYNRAGGIAGHIAGGDGSVIRGCFNYGPVSSGSLGLNGAAGAGGIVGGVSAVCTVEKCANLGEVTGQVREFYHLYGVPTGFGGIAGDMSAEGMIRSCYNVGTVDGPVFAGGIVGRISSGTVNSCYSTGAVNASNPYPDGTWANAGALVPSAPSGYAGGIAAYAAGSCVVSSCFNTGSVTASDAGGGASLVYAGGIIGLIRDAASVTVSVENCHYLDSCLDDCPEGAEILAVGTSASEEQLLSLAETLGSEFKDGVKHPLLTWQENAEAGVWMVSFSVTPAAAVLKVMDRDGNEVRPNSAGGGVYTYRLDEGGSYTYSVSADGYYSVEDELAPDKLAVVVYLTADERIYQTGSEIYGTGNAGKPNTISSEGTYQIGEGAKGVLTIETTGQVVLTGTENVLKNLYINCTVQGVDLTLNNVKLSNTTAPTNTLNFTGAGNCLRFKGTNILDLLSGTSGYALIHVPVGTELTIEGADEESVLYLYKSEQGAGIGGNGGNGSPLTPEYNGDITIASGKIFVKGTKQGALIGAGAGAYSAQSSPGNITIEGGELTMLANAGGAAIGGSAGETAATGANVYIKGGTITINVDFSGAAIGGGGYKSGQSMPNNDADGGNVYYYSGSVRTYVDENAKGAYGVEECGVNGNISITADIWNAEGERLYLCRVDTDELNIDGTEGGFGIYEGGDLIYMGGLHEYRYINEDRAQNDQADISDTTTNWTAGNDAGLYIYLTGEDHVLTINGGVYKAEWDESEESFAVYSIEAVRLSAPELEGPAEVGIRTVVLSEVRASAEEAAAVAEYRMSSDGGGTWGAWQESTEFTGLKADTEYCFQARYRAEDTLVYVSSAAGNTITVRTLADPNAFGYESEASGQTAEANVYGTSVSEAVDGSGTLTADLTTGGSGISRVTVTISGATLTAMAEAAEVYTFALETDLCTIRFDHSAVRSIAADADGEDAVLSIIKYSDTEYSFGLSVSGKAIFTGAEGGTISIELPYSREDAAKSVVVYDDMENDLGAAYRPKTEMLSLEMSRLSGITIREIKKGNPYAGVWDGLSLDISWFAPGRSSYYIGTPAQLMGLAALVNGIYNDEITTIVGEAGYIVDNVSGGGDSEDAGGSNQSTDTYHYGSYDFTGATVYLTADLDMGGSEGANYMPIGGQYLMSANDYETKISSSFCGTFDGNGYTVSNIYCDRYCPTNYGDGSSVGLIGRLGVHDNDPADTWPSGAAVRNVAVEGYFYANRSVGGIVGKIGKTSGGATIEGCVNYADVICTDTKGCGGIVGAGWNGGTVKNCYNAGTVSSSYSNPTAGISGSNEITLENCYNVGSISAGSSSYAMALGTNNGGAPYSSHVLNCWYLSGSAPGGGYYSGGTAYNGGALSSEYMKTAEFVEVLGSAFAMDTAGINGGYPVLSWQEQAKAGVEIKSTTTVKNGTATTSVTEKDVSASVTGARNEDVDTLLIITHAEGESVDKTVVEIPRSSVREIGNAKLSLTVETADGSRVTMTGELLTSAAGKAKGDTVELSVTPRSTEHARELLSKAEGYENTYLGNSVTVEISLSSGGTEVSGYIGEMSINIPVEGEPFRSGSSYEVLQVLGDGTVNRLSGKCVSDSGQLYVAFSTSELGTFIVLSGGESIYDDVGPDDWFHEAVMFVTELGLMNGVGDGRFEPNGTMTRAMMITVLYRLEGSPAVTGTGSFTDVEDGTWYTDAVAWAAGAGIVEGYGDGTFGPMDEVTREQMAAILYRYAENRGYDTDKTADLSRYTDSAEISPWAKRAMEWANGLELITGRTENTLTPGGSATRAEVATILMRFVRLFVQ